jgi:hypothetical protein
VYKNLKGSGDFSSGSPIGSLNATNIFVENIQVVNEMTDTVFSNIIILSGTADNLVIGSNYPADAFFNNVTIGSLGNGKDLFVYGDTPGKYLHWDPTINTLIISGELSVTGCGKFGNIQVCVNTISSTNTNGNVIISPNGTGTLNINSGITQVTTDGNTLLNSTNGAYTSTFGGSITTETLGGNIVTKSLFDNSLETQTGNIFITTGANVVSGSINSIFNQSLQVRVITSTAHRLRAGDIIVVSGTDSVPSFNGTYTVGSIINSTTFTVVSGITFTSVGTTGNYTVNNDAYVMVSSNNLRFVNDTIVSFEGTNPNDTVYFTKNNSNFTVSSISSNFIVSPSSYLQIAFDKSVYFGNSSGYIIRNSSDNKMLITNSSDITITTPTLRINGDLTVTGSLSLLDTTNLSIKDPIITLNSTVPVSVSVTDFGFQWNYYDTSAKTAAFVFKTNTKRMTYYSVSSNTAEVITGTIGDFEFNNLYLNNIIGSTITGSPDMTITATNINLTGTVNIPNNTNVNFSCGYIKEDTDLSLRLNSCYDIYTLSLAGRSIITRGRITLDTNQWSSSNAYIDNSGLNVTTLSASGGINLSSAARVQVNCPIYFSSSSNKIELTGSDLNVVAVGSIYLTAPTSIVVPGNTKVLLNSASEYLYSTSGQTVVLNSGGAVNINAVGNQTTTGNSITLTTTNGNINLTPTTGFDVIIPSSRKLYFGTNNYLQTSGSALNITTTTDAITLTTSGNINLTSGNIVIPTTSNFKLGSSTFYENTNKVYASATGGFQFTGNVDIIGNLTATGGLTTIETTNLTVLDPIIRIGGTTPYIINDAKDRGIETLYFDTSNKNSFFGMKNSTKRFVYYSNSTNTSEVISGTLGDIEIAGIYATSISLSSPATISGVSSIAVSTITGNPTVTLNATNFTINSPIDISSYILTTSGGTIQANSGGLLLNGVSSIQLNTTSGNITTNTNVTLNNNKYIQYGNSTIGSGSDGNTLTLYTPTNTTISSSSITLDTTMVNYGTWDIDILSPSGNLSIYNATRTLVLNSPITQVNQITFTDATSYIKFLTADALEIASGSGLTRILGNLTVTGNISGTWVGGIIPINYGGTGKSSWTQGSIVFMGSTTLQEDNSNFFWNDTTNRLGVGTNSPLQSVSIGNSGNLQLDVTTETDTSGIAFSNLNSYYNWYICRNNSVVSGTTSDLHFRGGSGTLASLSTFLAITSSGNIGINTTSPSQKLHIVGNSLTSGVVYLTDTSNYIQKSGSNVLINSSGRIDLQATAVRVGDAIPLQFGSSNVYLLNSGNDLTVASTNLTFTFTNGYISNGSYLNFGSNSIRSNTNELELTGVSSILLNTALTKIATGNTLQLGSSTLVCDVSNNLNITANSGGGVIISGVSLTVPSPVFFPGGSSLTVSSNNISINALNNILLNPLGYINVPKSTVLRFGAATERIYSTNSNVYIEAADSLYLTAPKTYISGQLIINEGNLDIFTSGADIITDSNLVILGNNERLTITALTDFSTNLQVTVSTVHNLLVGDTVKLDNTNCVPEADGTYTIIGVPSSTSFVVAFSIITSGTSGFVYTKLSSNTNWDLGIGGNYHTGAVGTANQKSMYLVSKASNQRLTYYSNGTLTGDIVSGTIGDIEASKLWISNISAFTLDGSMSAGSSLISGSNFTITGGTINGTVIGGTTPAAGTFSTITTGNAVISGGTINGTPIGTTFTSTGAFTSITVSSSSLVSNLNAQYLNGLQSSAFVLRNGTQGLTANWNAGSFDIASNTFTSSTLNNTCIIYSNSGTLTTNNNFTFTSGDTLNTPKISGYTQTGTVNDNNQTRTNVNITSGSISGTNINVSGQTLTLDDNQISGNKISGGTADCDISGNAATVTNGVYTTDYSNYTILKKDTGSVVALTVPTSSFVGRDTSGGITALSVSQSRALLSVPDLTEANGYAFGALLRSGNNAVAGGGNMTGVINYSTNRVSFTAPSTGNVITVAKNITYVTTTGLSGNAECSLDDGTIDGQWKLIVCSGTAGSTKLKITFPSGKFITGTGHSTSKSLVMVTGQSAHLLWDNTLSAWFIFGAGALLV